MQADVHDLIVEVWIVGGDRRDGVRIGAADGGVMHLQGLAGALGDRDGQVVGVELPVGVAVDELQREDLKGVSADVRDLDLHEGLFAGAHLLDLVDGLREIDVLQAREAVGVVGGDASGTLAVLLITTRCWEDEEQGGG